MQEDGKFDESRLSDEQKSKLKADPSCQKSSADVRTAKAVLEAVQNDLFKQDAQWIAANTDFHSAQDQQITADANQKMVAREMASAQQ